MKKLFLLTPALFLISCSDFFNSDKSSTPKINPEIAQGHKPFPPGYNPNEGTFSESKLLANIGLNVIVPQTRDLRLYSEILELEIQQWLKSPTQLQKESIQNKWKQVMLTYHFLDAAPVGPLADKNLKLAEQIYSWPYSNLCGVDHEVLKNSLSPLASAPALFTLKGLAVLEYVLFEKDLSTQCNANSIRNKPVIEWSQKPAAAKEKDRMNYAALIVRDLISKTKELENIWNPETFNYTHSLVDGSLYPNGIKDAVNALSDSLFSIEEVKDVKLAKPLGLHKECTSEDRKCPESAEHLWSGMALEAISAQVSGFEAAFMGADGFGFDDYLAQMGRTDVAEHMKENIDVVLNNLNAVKSHGSLQAQIQNMNPDECLASQVPICSLYQDVRVITTKMKTEFLTALSLKAPPTYQGDND